MKRALIIGLIALASATENSSAQGGGKGGAGATKPTEVTGLVVTDRGALGPTIQWSAIEKATYQVQRSKASDTGCCNNASPAGLTTTSWDDSPLPSSGVYVYRVTATLRSGQVVGATQFSYTAPAAPAVSGRYRLMVRSIEVVTPTTNDDPTQADGVGDEVYVAAIVVRADRATGAKLGATAVKSKEYGDIGTTGQPTPTGLKLPPLLRTVDSTVEAPSESPAPRERRHSPSCCGKEASPMAAKRSLSFPPSGNGIPTMPHGEIIRETG